MSADSTGAGRPPCFLVLVATCNGEPWVEEQLQTVLDQKGVELQILISDDASTDGTPAILRRLAEGEPRIGVFSRAKRSGSACANFLNLMREVDDSAIGAYAYVALCDQDDSWHPEKLGRAAQALSSSAAHLYSSAVTARWPSGRRIDLTQRPTPTGADHLFEGAGQGCTFVFSRAIFERIRTLALDEPELLAPLRYHDWLIYALTQSWGAPWLYDSVPTLAYRQHDANDTGARGSWSGVLLRTQRIRNGWYAAQVRAIVAVCRKINPSDSVASQVESLMDAAEVSIWDRLRWCRFLLTRSRRRISDRLVLSVFAGLGAL